MYPVRLYKKMSLLALIVWCTGCMRIYKDGDSFSPLFRFWNPFSYLVVLLAIIPCAIYGRKLSECVPFKLHGQKAKYKYKLKWLTPFTYF